MLLGTRSFWEGVDIPGEALSVLVIVKLPFAVPSDPLVAARSETFEDPFNEYHLPEAILRFRQGFGRLIRTQSDRGVVAILNRRVLTKTYGKLFIHPCRNAPCGLDRWQNYPGSRQVAGNIVFVGYLGEYFHFGETKMDEMMYEKLTEVQGRLEAELIESFLEANGVDAELIQGIHWAFSLSGDNKRVGARTDFYTQRQGSGSP